MPSLTRWTPTSFSFPKPHRIAFVFLMLWFRIDARTPFGVSVFHFSFWMMLVWSMFKSLHVACEAHFVFRPDSQPRFLACVFSCHGWGISEAGSVLWERPCLYVSSSLRCSHGWDISEAGSVLWVCPLGRPLPLCLQLAEVLPWLGRLRGWVCPLGRPLPLCLPLTEVLRQAENPWWPFLG